MNEEVIHISNGTLNDRRRQVTSKLDFFSQPIVYAVDHEKITFRAATLDDRKEVKTYNTGWGAYTLTIYSDYEVPLGEHEISEDSTEDELIVYYR